VTLAGLVAQAYPSPEWAVFYEVAPSTGFSQRRADAVALGIWPSRGCQLIGFEFKEHRSDWLRERKNPAKAEAVACHVDNWIVVAGAEGVVKVDELPEAWGLQVANKERTKLMVRKAALPFPDRDRRVIARTFAAAMLRRVGETMVPKSEVNRLAEALVEQRRSSSGETAELRILREQVQRHERIFDQFNEMTGVDLRSGWHGPKRIGAAVRAVMDGARHRDMLERTATQLEHAAEEVRKAVAQWPAAPAGVE
jgi:hypothetical protein